MNRTYNLYCDESCHIENDHQQYMLLGYVHVPYNQLQIHKEAIERLKQKHYYFGEIKWSNVANSQRAFYAELADYFFSTEIRYRALVVDKSLIRNESFGQDFNDFYFKMYWQLIYHKLDFGAVYNIYVDIKDTLSRTKLRELQHWLRIKETECIRTLQFIRSHESHFVQLADFLTGALSYHLNQPEGRVQAKRSIIDRIQHHTGHPLDCSTTKASHKFNLFFIDFQPRAF